MPDRSDGTTPMRPWGRTLLFVALGLVASIGVAFAGDRALHGGETLRGVVVAERALGGSDEAQVRAALESLDQELGTTPLAIRVRDQAIELDPRSVGFRIDVDAMVARVMASGREGNLGQQLWWWLGRLRKPAAVEVDAQLDTAALDSRLAELERSAIADPPFEGAIEVENDRAVARMPRPGFAIDRQAATDIIAAALKQKVRPEINLPLVQRQPTRGEEAVQMALAVAETLLSGDIELRGELPIDDEADGDAEKDDGKKKKKKRGEPEEEAPQFATFTFTRSDLAKALRSRLVEGGLEIELDAEALEPALATLRKRLERPAVDARFEIDKHDEVSIVPSRAGRKIETAKVAAALMAAAKTVERTGEVPIEVGAEATFTTEAAEALGIKGLVSKFTTTHPAGRPRVKNIHRIADLIDGVLLKPGDRFSINEHVGPRTTAKGFVPAPTIVLGEMEDTIGGGVSQFATTFYNAAFYGGYAILERQPHSYYFRRYPMGTEATLSFPKPDVIIENDTKAGLLIRTFYTPNSITVKFYGDNGGRKVERKKSALFDITDPPVEYIADDTLDPEEEKVKERGKVGWSVNVSRVITYPDGTEKKESRKVTYNPNVRRVRVHSCKIPKGADGYTGRPCPEPEPEEDDDDDDSTADDRKDRKKGDDRGEVVVEMTPEQLADHGGDEDFD
ncbi:MAG: VanW family protein [Polyangiaceae bacterium]